MIIVLFLHVSFNEFSGVMLDISSSSMPLYMTVAFLLLIFFMNFAEACELAMR